MGGRRSSTLLAVALVGSIAGARSATSADRYPIKTEKNAGFTMSDPAGDDDGPGSYTYPANPVYKPGSFDISEFRVVPGGKTVELSVEVSSTIEDPWDSQAWGGNGFSVQMVFVHIDTNHEGGSGVVEGLPGTHVRFAAAEAWDRVVIISPQGATRMNKEIQLKCPQWKDRIVIPRTTRASDRKLVAVVDVSALGGPPQESWGYQVLMQSNEGYPDSKELLTRRVNESAGPHRFGGGTDGDNDPHVIDILVPPGRDAAKEQHHLLSRFKRAITSDVKLDDLAVVPMVYPFARAK
jgi:C-terminal binding-module, SLH-like, of glucodextranase